MSASAKAPPVTRITPTQSVSLRFYLRELWVRRGLVRSLSARELKKRHEMNIVGFLWWMLEPLSLTLVYVIVIDIIFDRGGPIYPLIVAVGVFPWKWLSSSISSSMGVIRGNGNLLRDLYFPRALLPIVEVTTGLAHFLVGLLIIPVFMVAFRVGPSWSLLWLPVVIAVQFVFVLGLSLPMAVWGLSYRNLQGLVGNVIRLWFYLTPVIWPLSRLDGQPTIQTIVRLNPATGIIDGYREAIIYHTAPGWALAYSAGVGLLGLLLGTIYFVRREQTFGKLI